MGWTPWKAPQHPWWNPCSVIQQKRDAQPVSSRAFIERYQSCWRSHSLESHLVHWKLSSWYLFWNISVNLLRPLAGVEGCFSHPAEGFPSLARADASGWHRKELRWWLIVHRQCPQDSSSWWASQQLPAGWASFFSLFVLLWCISSIWSNFFRLILLLIIVFGMTTQLSCCAVVGAVLPLMALLPAPCLLSDVTEGLFLTFGNRVFMERHKCSYNCL